MASDIVKELIERSARLQESHAQTVQEMSQTMVDHIRYPWKHGVENIAEAVETIRQLGEREDES